MVPEVHDPIRFLTDLRDHLARHDRPIVFLFGAGTSCSVPSANRPDEPLVLAVPALTAKCREVIVALNKKYAQAWDAIKRECPQGHGHPNVEDILSRVRIKRVALGQTDQLCGLSVDELATLDAKITETIATEANPAPARIPARLPHDGFAAWVKMASRSRPLEIFTPNYDLLMERALERALIPVFDGFVGSYRPFFHADFVGRDELIPGKEWVRLWKIHGSINWTKEQTDSGLRVFRGDVSSDPVVIMPSHLKYDESRKQPYLALLDRLGRVLEQDGALLITCGYSFSDQHINAALFSVLENRERSHVIGLQYEDVEESHPVTKFALRTPRLLVAGPKRAVIGGRLGAWAASGAAASGDAIDVTEGESPKLLLGDFNVFCRFLESMTG